MIRKVAQKVALEAPNFGAPMAVKSSPVGAFPPSLTTLYVSLITQLSRHQACCVLMLVTVSAIPEEKASSEVNQNDNTYRMLMVVLVVI